MAESSEAALLAEIEALRDVLVFADGATKATGYALADLYAEDSPAQGVLRRAGCHPRTVEQATGSSTPSPSVTAPGETYGAVTGGNGRSPLPCPACGLPTWDGIHATGHRACGMHEVPGV